MKEDDLEKNINKKIFFSNKITTPKEFKTAEFWIKFIQKEIQNYKLIQGDNEKKEEIQENKEEENKEMKKTKKRKKRRR